MTKKQLSWIIGLLVVVVLAAVVLTIIVFSRLKQRDKNNVSNYEECVKQGNPILETFPEQCKTPDGKTFVKEITSSSSSSNANSNTSDTTSQNTSTTSSVSNVKVYFSKDPSSYDDPSISVAVERSTNRVDIGSFALESLILGPTSDEQVNGLFTPVIMIGDSNCDGRDFTLNIVSKKATLKLCKMIQLAGELDGERIETVIENTLKQFSTVSSVVILTRDNHCFNDLSGLDKCKE